MDTKKIKKIVAYLLVFVLFVGIPSCCRGFYVIKNIIGVSFIDWNQGAQIQGATYSGDTLALELNFGSEFFSDGFEGTMRSAWAFSCDNRTVNEIVDIDITSTGDFNGISAGLSLRSQLLLAHFIGDALNTPADFDANLQTDFGLSSILIVFTNKPSATVHQFSMEAIDDSGNKMTFTTQPIKWE